jgi:hypothetical protein
VSPWTSTNDSDSAGESELRLGTSGVGCREERENKNITGVSGTLRQKTLKERGETRQAIFLLIFGEFGTSVVAVDVEDDEDSEKTER